MSELIEAALVLIKNNGLLGFVIVALVFAVGWFIYRITSHFIVQINNFHSILKERDALNFKMANQFSEVVRELTQVIDRDLSVKIDMAEAHRDVATGFDRMAEQNRQEHIKILEHVIYARTGKPGMA